MKRNYRSAIVFCCVFLLLGCGRKSSNKTVSESNNKDNVQTEQTASPELASSSAGDEEEEQEILTNEGSAEEEAALRNTFAAVLPFTSGDDKICAIAYMGNTKETQENSLKSFYTKYFADYTEEQLASISTLNYGGEECYLFIPRYEDSKISLNRMELKDNRMNIVQTEEVDADAFLIYCNPSREYANVEISIGHEGRTFVLVPRLSTMDDHMEPMQIALDLTEEAVYSPN